MGEILPIVVPKWGLEMEEGRLVAWLVEEGQSIRVGDELIEIETSKVTNSLESPYSGVLRRKVAKLDETYSCGTLIGVIANAEVSDQQIDLFISGYSIVAKRSDATADSPAFQEIGVDGMPLRFLQQGQGGVPVVLLHGFCGDLDNWLLIQQRLAVDRAVYAIDLPGHGGSSKDLSAIDSFDDVANALLGFLDAQRIDIVHLVAHSMGAPVALGMARRAPGSIETLTLLAPAGLGGAVRGEFIQGLLTATTRRQVSEALKFLFARPELVTRELAENVLKFKRLDGVTAALNKYADFLARETQTPHDALQGITAPISLLWGVNDQVIRPVAADVLPRDVELVLLQNTGHMPHVEQSDASVDVIRKRIEASSRART